MSYTKATLNTLLKAQNKIHEDSISSNDLTGILNLIDSTMYVKENIKNANNELEPLLNEVVSDVISVISTALQGHYRLAISGLRNILEISCSVIFYKDHPIEYKLYRDSDFKADKYVTTLINDFHFFKTNYIRIFYSEIDSKEKKVDECSSYLNKTYAKLCDNVHGRFLTLTKVEGLKIEYNQQLFSKFRTMLEYTLGAFFLMYALRFNDFGNQEVVKIINKTKTLK